MMETTTPPERLMANLTYRRAIERLCGCGPRAVGELISNLAQHEGCDGAVLDLLYRYGRLTPEMVRVAGADAMPPNPLHCIARRAG